MIDRRQFIATGLLAGLSTKARAESRGEVEIRRDAYGVPYIFGRTDADCAFGLGYAQAEDGFDYIEDCFLRAIGRGAEAHGGEAYSSDLKSRALEIVRHSRAEYARSSAPIRRIYDAYRDGLERYAAEHRAGPRALARIEPWHPLALLRFKYYVEEFLDYAGLSDTDWAKIGERPNGSNAWAVAPSRSASGRAMLMINPHVGFFGVARYYECTLLSEEGLQFQGISRCGFPLPYMGHNDRLGWAYTDNYPDNGDLYAQEITKRGGQEAYRYAGEWRPVRSWTETIQIRKGSRQTSRKHRFQATHHGPIMGVRDGKPLAVRLAKFVEGGWFDQWYDMCRARNLVEFRSAVSRCAVAYMNVIHADADGNIGHIYGGAVPKRPPSIDWSNPVDGSDPATEWQGYHQFNELPQTLNPPSGYVQSCNSTPFTVAGDGPENRTAFPPYMIGPETDNLRAKRSRAILGGTASFSYEQWQRSSTDTRLYAAADGVPELAGAWKAMPAGQRRDALAPLIAKLTDWDGVARIESEPTTLFLEWFSRRRLTEGPTAEDMLIALEEARDGLIGRFGRWQVAWGEANRLQRVSWSSPIKFSDHRPSLPVPGAPGWAGVIFNFYTDSPVGTVARYGMLGNSYVATVEFGPAARSDSVLVFGQAMEPNSTHYLDQSDIYAAGKFKANFWPAAKVLANTTTTRRLRRKG